MVALSDLVDAVRVSRLKDNFAGRERGGSVHQFLGRMAHGFGSFVLGGGFSQNLLDGVVGLSVADLHEGDGSSAIPVQSEIGARIRLAEADSDPSVDLAVEWVVSGGNAHQDGVQK